MFCTVLMFFVPISMSSTTTAMLVVDPSSSLRVYRQGSIGDRLNCICVSVLCRCMFQFRPACGIPYRFPWSSAACPGGTGIPNRSVFAGSFMYMGLLSFSGAYRYAVVMSILCVCCFRAAALSSTILIADAWATGAKDSS